MQDECPFAPLNADRAHAPLGQRSSQEYNQLASENLDNNVPDTLVLRQEKNTGINALELLGNVLSVLCYQCGVSQQEGAGLY